MKWFKNLKISHKLTLGFGLCLGFCLLIAIGALNRMSMLNDETAQIVNGPLQNEAVLARVSSSIRSYRVKEVKRAALKDAAEIERMNAALDKNQAELDALFAEYSKNVTSNVDKANLDKLIDLWKDYSALKTQKAGDKESVQAFLARSEDYAKVSDQIDVVAKWNEDEGVRLDKQADKSYASTRGLVMMLMALAVLVGSMIAYSVTRMIVRAVSEIGKRVDSLDKICLNNLGKAVDALAQGDLTTTIATGTVPLDLDSKDEFGRLAVNINAMIARIQGTVESFSQAQDSLSVLLAKSRFSADAIASSATEVSAGNSDLSQRTEEQAANLEETASSMEEMTSTVKQNADNSQLANQLAGQARSVAEGGGAVVGEAVTAMNEINEGSKRIAEIISVIDEIAFQTNLLALNAAVEAARVGEQGKGFAVVAAEVRNLAGRSATAAKEIKALVQDSVGKVEDGTRLVHESGERLNEIVAAVKKVADVVAEISAASLEQSAGIEQVNKAVMQMDQVTQQNATLVEEVSAASLSMSRQANELQSLVTQFKVEPKYLLSVQQSQSMGMALRDGTTGMSTASARPKKGSPALKVVAGDDEFEEF